MKSNNGYTINVHGRLMDLSQPQVMGILNCTPDSFYAGSRVQTERAIAERALEIVGQGGSIIDIGAFSTRPGADEIDEKEECMRISNALAIVRRECPDAVISIDTFRPNVARMAVEEYGADIINDVSEGGVGSIADQAISDDGEAYPEIFKTVARLRVPYILMSVRANLHDTLMTFSKKVQQLRDLGQKDIILDPGFGFGKTLEENYRLLDNLDKLNVFGLPLLVGVSRKRMIYQLLDTTADEALNGTVVVNTVALMKGASILRVHDVREAVEAVKIVCQTRNLNPEP
ncbi:MAG: dihydropteroate synthase [Prevotella sp.]|nr:dihydropteroate synthase [Prevotella sp.]MBR7049572.1 dihydropteroate synthase [Prevotella sp.]